MERVHRGGVLEVGAADGDGIVAVAAVPLGVVTSAQQGVAAHIHLLPGALGVGGEGVVEVVEEALGGKRGGGNDHSLEGRGAVEEGYHRIRQRCALLGVKRHLPQSGVEERG